MHEHEAEAARRSDPRRGPQATPPAPLRLRPPSRWVAADVLALQRTAGNAAVAGVLYPQIQRHISGGGDVPLGKFEIDMKKVESTTGGNSGEDGTVAFKPDPKKGPTTNNIRLSQIVKTVDLGTSSDVDWSTVGTGAEGDRNKMMTSATDLTHTTRVGDTLERLALRYYGDPARAGDIANQADNKLILKSTDPKEKIPKKTTLKIPNAVRGGFFIDHLAADSKATPRTSKADRNVPQDYVWPGEEVPGKNEHGFKKKGSRKDAILKDFPGTDRNWSFAFETVARSVDRGIFYGTINWSFEVSGGKVTKEAHSVMPGTSETFNRALDEFNKFYKNKHVVVKNETLQSISQKYYGTPNKWKEIFDANKDKIKDANHIEPGWELTIPKVSAE